MVSRCFVLPICCSAARSGCLKVPTRRPTVVNKVLRREIREVRRRGRSGENKEK
ncbi:hypothetical protein Pint_26934 [Pistacia integerrima]|uniref:Uncharacterized protein n=1 Tax=Pistacia integerrima TaxID=434235 RepID=A0ACC0YST0_9ROSI|nr:hypothetical protein Pint_26934 [Pistacia integerrima]